MVSEGDKNEVFGYMAEPTSVPTRSMRGSARKSEGAQYGVVVGEGVNVGVVDEDGSDGAVAFATA